MPGFDTGSLLWALGSVIVEIDDHECKRCSPEVADDTDHRRMPMQTWAANKTRLHRVLDQRTQSNL